MEKHKNLFLSLIIFLCGISCLLAEERIAIPHLVPTSSVMFLYDYNLAYQLKARAMLLKNFPRGDSVVACVLLPGTGTPESAVLLYQKDGKCFLQYRRMNEAIWASEANDGNFSIDEVDIDCGIYNRVSGIWRFALLGVKFPLRDDIHTGAGEAYYFYEADGIKMDGKSPNNLMGEGISGLLPLLVFDLVRYAVNLDHKDKMKDSLEATLKKIDLARGRN